MEPLSIVAEENLDVRPPPKVIEELNLFQCYSFEHIRERLVFNMSREFLSKHLLRH